MLSNKAKYALKSLIYLAQNGGDKPVFTSTIAFDEKMPRKFLENILVILRNEGFLTSIRGKSGGYKIAMHPSKIKMGEVVRLIDGPLAPTPCVSLTAYKKCSECIEEESCKVRLIMKEVRDAISRVLDNITLEEAAITGLPDFK